MKKYRIVTKKEIYHWDSIDSYSVEEAYYVQRRVLFFFWITMKSFWGKNYADSYFKALTEIENHKRYHHEY